MVVVLISLTRDHDAFRHVSRCQCWASLRTDSFLVSHLFHSLSYSYFNMHITMPFTVHYTPTQRATTPTLTSTTPFPYHDAKFKENITPSPPLNVSQPSPKVRNQSLRKRNRMSSAQLARLESLFRKDTHPSRQKKKELADELGL